MTNTETLITKVANAAQGHDSLGPTGLVLHMTPAERDKIIASLARTTPSDAQVEATLAKIVSAYDAYRARGVMPAPRDYAQLVAAIDEGRAALTAAAQAGEEKTIDTTKLNAGQLVQRIMRVMDHNDAGSGGIAKLAEAIAAGILNLPADYWTSAKGINNGPRGDPGATDPVGTCSPNDLDSSRNRPVAATAPAPPAQSGVVEDDLVLDLLRPVMLHSNPEQTNAERRRAAARIATLTQALAEAEKVIEPFAKAGDYMAHINPKHLDDDQAFVGINYSDLRAACTWLERRKASKMGVPHE